VGRWHRDRDRATGSDPAGVTVARRPGPGRRLGDSDSDSPTRAEPRRATAANLRRLLAQPEVTTVTGRGALSVTVALRRLEPVDLQFKLKPGSASEAAGSANWNLNWQCTMLRTPNSALVRVRTSLPGSAPSHWYWHAISTSSGSHVWVTARSVLLLHCNRD
jgi:hypothetical protein